MLLSPGVPQAPGSADRGDARVVPARDRGRGYRMKDTPPRRRGARPPPGDQCPEADRPDTGDRGASLCEPPRNSPTVSHASQTLYPSAFMKPAKLTYFIYLIIKNLLRF